LCDKFSIESVHALGYGYYKYFQYCMQAKADLFIMHQEMSTVLGCRLDKSGKKVAFDLEDWYSEDLLPEARKSRPNNLLKKSEAYACNNCLVYTTSKAMSIEMSKVFRSKRPEVIYNVFPKFKLGISKEPLDKRGRFSFFWFSQTIGPGRGLEELFDALILVKESIELNLLGNCSAGFKNSLIKLLPKQHKITFYELVNPEDLPRVISNFDIGLALEKTNPLSRDLTVTNKMFQYLNSGLCVVATPTRGQKEIAEIVGGCVKLSLSDNSSDLALAINSLLDSPPELRKLKNEAYIIAKEKFNWETESSKLLQLLNNYITPTV
jgi:glycosyltransferase involved in cell wall biosynthesis